MHSLVVVPLLLLLRLQAFTILRFAVGQSHDLPSLRPPHLRVQRLVVVLLQGVEAVPPQQHSAGGQRQVVRALDLRVLRQVRGGVQGCTTRIIIKVPYGAAWRQGRAECVEPGAGERRLGSGGQGCRCRCGCKYPQSRVRAGAGLARIYAGMVLTGANAVVRCTMRAVRRTFVLRSSMAGMMRFLSSCMAVRPRPW